jgi:hypothetical protein
VSLYFFEAVVEYCLAPIGNIRGGCMLRYFLVCVVCLFVGRVVFADTYVQGYQRRNSDSKIVNVLETQCLNQSKLLICHSSMGSKFT